MIDLWIARLREWHRLNTWDTLRRKLALSAMLSSTLTVSWILMLSELSSVLLTMMMYLGITALACFYPAGITAQVLVGQLLVAGMLFGPSGIDPLVLVPAVAGVIVTAELLAVVARLDTPIASDPGAVAPAVTRAGLLGAAAFGVVAMSAVVPGPSGMLAVLLAAGAGLFIASRLFGLPE